MKTGVLVCAVVGLLAAGASAGPLSGPGDLGETLIDGAVISEQHVVGADETVARSCHATLHEPGTAGVDRRTSPPPRRAF